MGGLAEHDVVLLEIGADEEVLLADDLKAVFGVEGDGAGVAGEDGEPDAGVWVGGGEVEDVAHEGVGEAGSVMGGVEVELAEFEGGGGLDGGGGGGLGEDGVADGGVGDGEEEGVVAVVLEEGEEALGGELGADVVVEV